MNSEANTTITCGRCGRENRGSPGRWLGGAVCGPGVWDEPGWVYLTSPPPMPLEPPAESRLRVISCRYPERAEYVCPGCLLDEERPPEGPPPILCSRCGRERCDGEPGWVEVRPAIVERIDGIQDWNDAHRVGRRGDVCPGCLTGEEHERLDEIVWGEPPPS
jgi:hypothetical protein